MPVSYDNYASPMTSESEAPNVDLDAVMEALQGDLSEKPITYLLQAAAYYEATGHLYVGTGAFYIKVQFGLGKPVNATSSLVKGEEAVIDLFTWSSGQLVFELGKQPESVNILETSEGLIAKGEAFLANLRFLEENYINETSFLIRSSKLSKRKLEAIINLSSLHNAQTMLEMYGNIYGTLNLTDVAERMGIRRSEWVSAAAELLRLGLLLAPDGRSLQQFDTSSANLTQDEEAPVVPRQVNTGKPSTAIELPSSTGEPQLQALSANSNEVRTFRAGIPEMRNLELSHLENSLKSLSNPDTELLTDETFTFMLSHEFARAHRFGSILTLAVFCISVEAPGNAIAMSELRLITKALLETKRETDLLGHFGENSFAFLLPNVDSTQTCIMVDRINQSLPTMLPTLGHLRPMLHFGISTAPSDATSIVALSTMAQANMRMAAEKKLNRLTF